jgi:phosphatidylglycerophosphatase A
MNISTDGEREPDPASASSVPASQAAGDLPASPDQSTSPPLPPDSMAGADSDVGGESVALNPVAVMAMTAAAQTAGAEATEPLVRKIRRPDWGFLISHPAHWFALGFGSGLPWVVPGTFGTLFGWATFVVMAPYLTDAGWAATIVLAYLLGIWACGVTGRNLGVSDHGSIVWDEIVAIWLVLWFVPKTVGDQAVAFLIFRVIDIVKPQPIRYFDTRWKNGFGVMFDDLLAAFFTLLIFAVYYRFVGLPT